MMKGRPKPSSSADSPGQGAVIGNPGGSPDPAKGGRPRTLLRSVILLTLSAILPLVIAVAYLLLHSGDIANAAADAMAGNMVPPDSQEVAITPFSPAASTVEVAALSGRGEGLDCSIPEIANRIAFSDDPDAFNVGLQYRQACVAHDYCYRHGAATYGYAQADCDSALARAALRICIRGADDLSAQGRCVLRARKVYAGLLARGAGAFRSELPDAELAFSRKDENAADPERCGIRRNVVHAIAAWTEKLAMRLKRAAPCQLRLAVAGEYNRMDGPSLDGLLHAWLDLASVAGEYDPYPLGTARLSVPRIATSVDGSNSLFFYMQRPGGGTLNEYRWHARDGEGVQTLCQGSTCDAPRRITLSSSESYRFLPGPPWVVPAARNRLGLLWWRRLTTSRDSTGGNPARLAFGPRAGPSGEPALLTGANWDLMAPTLFPVAVGGSDARIAGLYFDDNRRGLVLCQLLLESRDKVGDRSTSNASPASVAAREGREGIADSHRCHLAFDGGPRRASGSLFADYLWHDQLLSALSIPPQILPVEGGVDLTVFSRSGAGKTYTTQLDAIRCYIPDAPSNPTTRRINGAPCRTGGGDTASAAAHVRYQISEEEEPFAALPDIDAPPLLLSLQCQRPPAPSRFEAWKQRRGLSEQSRCDPERTGTVVTLTGPRLEKPLAAVEIGGRFTSRVPIVRTGPSSFAAVLVRFSIEKDGTRFALVGHALVVTAAGSRLEAGTERRLGIVSAADERSVREALIRATRVMPIIGDTDGRGGPDLVIADPVRGNASLSFAGRFDRDGRLFY